MLSAIANPQPATMAAPGWQFAFVSLAIVVLLLEIIHGWRLGLIRQLVRVIAIVVAYSCAFFAARATVPLMHSFFKLPDPILALLGGAILAAILFAAINLIGAFLFKKTAQQESRFIRLIWGSTGAFLGILLGLFTIWLGFAGVRMVGSVADPRVLELIATGHIFELMKNQRMIEAMNDPALQARVKKFELERHWITHSRRTAHTKSAKVITDDGELLNP